jgi:aarF domain-containing kinase
MKELMQQTINFPKELLFISRNMNLVRSLNKFYGGQADRISIMAKTAYVGSKFDNAGRNSFDYKRNK